MRPAAGGGVPPLLRLCRRGSGTDLTGRSAVASGNFEMEEPFGAQLKGYFIHPQLAEKSPAAR
ncbi:hypothetical protein HMPREF0262_00664 [Clostridium sp. ATCC 29733]|nr:hypothetical protein HMPREF0262_00664 [Clostridium sp. ATCC 29733]